MARQQRPKTNNILKLGIPSTGLSAAAYKNRLNEDFVKTNRPGIKPLVV